MPATAMLEIYFENVITRQRRHIGPQQSLRIAGVCLFGADGAVLAEYQGGLWRHENQHFFIVGIQSPVMIHFENAAIRSESHGPYNPAWLINGAIRIGESQETALARLDEQSGAWHVYADRTFWSTVVVCAAGGC